VLNRIRNELDMDNSSTNHTGDGLSVFIGGGAGQGKGVTGGNPISVFGSQSTRSGVEPDS